MHITEGILSVPVLAGGGTLAALGVFGGLRALHDDEIPRTAMLTAAFFVAGLINVPVGAAHMHLILNGLMGLLLGWRAFPAILIALTLQAVLFRYGGLTTLGVNTIIMATPAVLAYHLLTPMIRRASARSQVLALGACAGVIGILVGLLLAAAALALTDQAFLGFAALFAVAHLPLMVVEAVITGGLTVYLWRIKPDLFMARTPS